MPEHTRTSRRREELDRLLDNLLSEAAQDLAPADLRVLLRARGIDIDAAIGEVMSQIQSRETQLPDQQLSRGTRVSGRADVYSIMEPLRLGEFDEVYLAVPVSHSDLGAVDIEKVVVRVPRTDLHQTSWNAPAELCRSMKRWTAVRLADYERLPHTSNVVRPIDSGEFEYTVPGLREALQAPFFVYPWIEGRPLFEHLSDSRGFRGVKTAREFFRWARRIVAALRELHRYGVAHGDVSPATLLVVPETEEIRLLDLGASVFREATEPGHRVGPGDASQPPEGVSAAGDIFALGAVLYFLATGQTLPAGSEKASALKESFAQEIEARNPMLYREHSGVADVIARCLGGGDGHVAGLEIVLDDIDTMGEPQPSWSQVEIFTNSAKEIVATALDSRNTEPWLGTFFSLGVQLARHALADMQKGVMNLIGDHELIVRGTCQLFAGLGKGDQYITITIPEFWRDKNLGVNGRLLTLHKIAAQRGVRILRLFVLPPLQEALADSEIPTIIRAHNKVSRELEAMEIPTDRSVLESDCGYYNSYTMLPPKDVKALVAEGLHVGVMRKAGHDMVLTPTYGPNGQVNSVHCRWGVNVGAVKTAELLSRIKDAQPLRELAPWFPEKEAEA